MDDAKPENLGGRLRGFSPQTDVARRALDGARQWRQDPRLVGERLRCIAQEEQHALGLARRLRDERGVRDVAHSHDEAGPHRLVRHRAAQLRRQSGGQIGTRLVPQQQRPGVRVYAPVDIDQRILVG